MTEQIPFNPIPIPPNLKLEQGSVPDPDTAAEQAPGASQQQRPRRKTTRSRRVHPDPKPSEETRWQRIKGRLTAKLAQMDQETLRRVLLGTGIAAGLIAAILLLIKLMPAAMVLLALLGIGLALQVWDRLRYYPRPF